MKIKHVEDLQQKLDEKINTSVIIDEDDFSSNSDEKLPTQQSVKAYVDNLIGVVNFVEFAEEFTFPYTAANETIEIVLSYNTKANSEIDITINGANLSNNQYTHTPQTNIITIQMPYEIDSNDIIRIIYKH